jgi:hypothetical protein
VVLPYAAGFGDSGLGFGVRSSLAGGILRTRAKMSRRRVVRPTLSRLTALRGHTAPRLTGARAAAAVDTALESKPLLILRWRLAGEWGSGRTQEMPGLGFEPLRRGGRLRAGGLWRAVRSFLESEVGVPTPLLAVTYKLAPEVRGYGSRHELMARDFMRAGPAGPRALPSSPGLTDGREEARLACLAHDSRRSTGTIVFRLVVPAMVIVPDTAALSVSIPGHYER